MDMGKKLQNFWFYYKKHLLVGLAVLGVAGYLAFQSAATPEPDYHIGLVRSIPFSDAELHALEARFTAAAEDVNGDGEVLVQIHTYYVDLADDSLNAGVRNEQSIAALDADLIGGTSGIFLLEDVNTFRQLTNGILENVIPHLDQGLFLALRKDANPIYKTLAEKLH